MILYVILVMLLAGLVARAVDWYPAHIERQEQAMIAAALAHDAGDEDAWTDLEARYPSGPALLRDFLGTVPSANGRIVLALVFVFLIAGWSFMSYGATLSGAAWLAWGCGLVVLGFVDARTKLLPDALTLPLLWLGVGLQLFPETRTVGLEAAVWGVLAGYVPLWLVAQLYRLLRGRDGLGMGDLKLLAAMGAWSGALVLPPVVFVSAFLALVGVVVTRLLHRQDLQQEFPFGPWIIVAYMLCVAAGINIHSV